MFLCYRIFTPKDANLVRKVTRQRTSVHITTTLYVSPVLEANSTISRAVHVNFVLFVTRVSTFDESVDQSETESVNGVPKGLIRMATLTSVNVVRSVSSIIGKKYCHAPETMGGSAVVVNPVSDRVVSVVLQGKHGMKLSVNSFVAVECILFRLHTSSQVLSNNLMGFHLGLVV